ncbi:MAG TPA: hypothetical protein VM580_03975 [Labilithrix sp.]|nr:hypothetical protein [Labilithrix sp.]
MTEKRKVGSHEIWREPDTGFVYYAQVGRLVETEAHALREIFGAYARSESPHVGFALCDFRRSEGSSPEARKVMSAAWDRDITLYTALFGGAFALRVIATLSLKAAELVSDHRVHSTVVATEENARKWLREQQEAFSAAHGKR